MAMKTYTIAAKNGLTHATFVPERGGMGTSIVMPGRQGPRELLFHENTTGGWPFCFPICGRLERQSLLNHYYYDGHLYELPIHGFASQKPWTVSDAGENHLLLVLRDDEQTRAVYPFHFTVELFYEIADRRLFCRQTYTNHGDRPLPYYAGFHPYFLANDKNHVTLNCQPQRRLRYNQQLTDIVGEQALFALPASAANPEIHEQLLELGEDKQICLSYPDQDVVCMAAEGAEDPNLFPYLQIYSPPDQPFICVEPWMGYPNAFNSMSGVRWLAPGCSEHGILRLWLE
jgi:galactose mutarotase-like enzyme